MIGLCFCTSVASAADSDVPVPIQIPLPASAGPTRAWAPTLYISGSLDVVVRHDSGTIGGSNNSVGPGGLRSSRLTFGANSPIGYGLKSQIVLEAGIAPDTGLGANNPPGQGNGIVFGRTAAAGLGSDGLGYISLGRQFTPMQAVSAGPANDPFGGAWLGGVATLYNKQTGASNSISYTYGYTSEALLRPAPKTGLGVAVLYSFGEGVSPAPKRAGQQEGFNVSWGDGRWWFGYAYEGLHGSNSTLSATAPAADKPLQRQQTLGGAYDFGWARLILSVNRGTSSDHSLNRTNYDVAGTVPVTSVSKLLFLYGRANDKTAANADFKSLQLGYQYDFTPNTAVYGAFAQASNSAHSAVAPAGMTGTLPKGATGRSSEIGVRVMF